MAYPFTGEPSPVRPVTRSCSAQLPVLYAPVEIPSLVG